MADIFDRVPAWLKSLYQIETELRSAARKGVFLQTDKALEHLAEARRHIDEMTKNAKGPESSAVKPLIEPPLHKDGEI